MTFIHIKTRIKVLLLTLILTCSITAQNSNVKISINKNNITIKEALQEVERQTSMSVAYNQSKLNDAIQLDLKATNQPLNEVLEQILAKTGFTFEIKDDQIMIIAQKETLTPIKRTITGTIVDESDFPIIGGTIVIKGTATGVTSDINGNYSISASTGDILVFSYLGYQSQEITVGNNTIINVKLQSDVQELETVVVTALGIKRAQKALSYNVQEIKSDELTTVKDVNFMNSLAGKVAGVNINASSTGIGGASRVVMRGVKSITKDNNALYVIDGVPIYNTSGGAIDENYIYADQPSGEGISDLNPDDIESMSVLTGPAAAALYGSNAANGVILITTKKGIVGKPKVTVSNQLTFSKPVTYYEFQNKYAAATNQYASWGPETTGLKNNRMDFFETGIVNQISASLSVGNERNQTYASLSNSYSEGVIPENEYKKTNLTLRNTTNFLNEKMTLDFGFSYIKQSDKNMIGQGQYFNPLPSVYTFPVGSNITDYKNFETYDEAKGYMVQNWPAEYNVLDSENPYWLLNRMPRTNDRNRYMVNVNLKYEITDWLNIAGRFRLDNSRTEEESKFYASTKSTFSKNDKTGKYRNILVDDKQTYADIILNMNKYWGDYSLNAVVGGSISDTKSISKGMDGPLVVPNYFAVTNLDMSAKATHPIHTGWHQQDQSIFTSIEAGHKNMLYLTLTGRNDWSSALAKTKHTSFFYYSAGLSFLLTEAFNLPSQINYLQLKGSYSSVGSPIPRNLSIVTYPYNKDNRHYEASSFLPISNLKPERTNSWEIGLTAKLFNNALNFDFTYYHSNTINQTLALNISAMSLYNKMYVQAGDVRNNGIELGIGTNLKLGNVTWNSNFTAGWNGNKILKLIDKDATVDVDGEEVLVGDKFKGEREAIGASIYRLTEGGTMGDLYVKKQFKKDKDGNLVLDPTEKRPILEDTEQYVGSVLPKWNLGFRNSFTWKDFNFGFMLSARFGGVVMSPTEAILDGYGVTKKTAKARDRGYVESGNVIFSPRDYYETVGSREGLLADYVYKANNIRLQEISIGYTIPKKVFKDKLKLNLSFVASNLWLIYKDAPFDPEMTGSTGTFFQGIDFFMQPNTRNLGFSIKAEF